jgi:hexosaminidase
MWTDRHEPEALIDARVYPRACAMAEVLWSPAESRDYNAFLARLRNHLPRLEALGVSYQPI